MELKDVKHSIEIIALPEAVKVKEMKVKSAAYGLDNNVEALQTCTLNKYHIFKQGYNSGG